MSRVITISDLHNWINEVAPDCTERKTLHLVLERLRQYEVGQVPTPRPPSTVRGE